MKKTLAAVLAAGALLIGGISSVDAANWYTVGTDSNGITWSIDNDSVKKMIKKLFWTSKLWTTKVTTIS